MQLLFIDESGTIPPKDKSAEADCFALGGIIIPEHLWHDIEKDLGRLKKHFKVVGEIKWRYFAQQKNATINPLSHLCPEDKEQLKRQIYAIISKYKAIKLICAVVNINSAYKLGYVNDDNDLYWYAYKQITERFQYYLQDLTKIVGQKINGIIVVDNRQSKADEHLRNLHSKLLTGSKDNFSTFGNLIEGVFIAPSHLSVGIQLADMVGGAVFRNAARNDSRYFDLIKSSFRASPTNKIEGYGLISWPK